MKIQLMKFLLEDKDILQQHLDNMADQGWYLDSISNSFIIFEKRDTPYYYMVDYNYKTLKEKGYVEAKIADENTSKTIQHCKEAHTAYFHIYYMMERSSEFLNTLIHEDALTKERNHLRWRYCWLPLFIIFCSFTICYGYPQLFLTLLSYNISIILSLLLFITLPFCIISTFNQPLHTSSYKKKIRKIKIRSVFTWLFDFISLVLIVSILILFNHSDSSKGTLSWAVVCLLIGKFIFQQLGEKKSYIKLILIAGLLYFSLDFFYSHFLTVYHPTVTSPSTFSSDVTELNHNTCESKNYQSILIKYKSCILENDDNYFDYQQYDTKSNFITDLAMRSLTKNRKVVKTYEYKGVEVYTPDRDNSFMSQKYKWQPFLVLRKNHHLIALTSNNNFHKNRIIEIINELNW